MSALTRDAIEHVLGPTDDTVVAALVAVGATEEELREAHAWVVNNEALVNDMRPFPTGRVGELVEMLRPLEGISFDEDER